MKDRRLRGGDGLLERLSYQLSSVRSRPTEVLTGDGESGFDSGEGARETAATSKEGSRRANYPLHKKARVRGSDEKYRWRALTGAVNRNENSPESWPTVSDEAFAGRVGGLSSIDRRASLVPAAAVTPAPKVYA